MSKQWHCRRDDYKNIYYLTKKIMSLKTLLHLDSIDGIQNYDPILKFIIVIIQIF